MRTNTEPDQLKNLRKAAILVSSLDPISAAAMFQQMSPRHAARVQQAAEQLGEVDRAEQEQVIAEFLKGQPAEAAAAPSDSGVEFDSSLTAKFSQPGATARSAADSPPHDPATPPPFGFLQQAPVESLVKHLRQESPQTIAVVLAHLPARRAADVLAQLHDAVQTEVLLRIAQLDDTNPSVIREIESQLQTLLQDELRVVEKRSAGLAAVAAILNATGGGAQQALLAKLARRDDDFAAKLGAPPALRARSMSSRPTAEPIPPAVPATQTDQLRRLAALAAGSTPKVSLAKKTPATAPRILPFRSPAPKVAEPALPRAADVNLAWDDLQRLEDRALAAVLKAADPQVALLALMGGQRELVDRLLRQLPAAEAKGLKNKMSQVGPLRLSDVREAQGRLADVASDLAARGLIRLPKKRLATAA